MLMQKAENDGLPILCKLRAKRPPPMEVHIMMKIASTTRDFDSIRLHYAKCRLTESHLELSRGQKHGVAFITDNQS